MKVILCFLGIDFELPFLHIFDNQFYVGLKIFGCLSWAPEGGRYSGAIGVDCELSVVGVDMSLMYGWVQVLIPMGYIFLSCKLLTRLMMSWLLRSLYSRASCQTVSKAFSKSNKISCMILFLLCSIVANLVTLCNWWMHKCFFLKPNC